MGGGDLCRCTCHPLCMSVSCHVLPLTVMGNVQVIVGILIIPFTKNCGDRSRHECDELDQEGVQDEQEHAVSWQPLGPQGLHSGGQPSKGPQYISWSSAWGVLNMDSWARLMDKIPLAQQNEVRVQCCRSMVSVPPLDSVSALNQTQIISIFRFTAHNVPTGLHQAEMATADLAAIGSLEIAMKLLQQVVEPVIVDANAGGQEQGNSGGACVSLCSCAVFARVPTHAACGLAVLYVLR